MRRDIARKISRSLIDSEWVYTDSTLRADSPDLSLEVSLSDGLYIPPLSQLAFVLSASYAPKLLFASFLEVSVAYTRHSLSVLTDTYWEYMRSLFLGALNLLY